MNLILARLRAVKRIFWSQLGEAVIFSKHSLTTSAVLAIATVKGSSTGAIAQTANKVTASESRATMPTGSIRLWLTRVTRPISDWPTQLSLHTSGRTARSERSVAVV